MQKFDRKKIVQSIFEMTGEKVGESDPVVTASMIFAHETRSAATEVSQRIAAASLGTLMAARQAEATCAKIGADQAKFMRELHGRLRSGEPLPRSSEEGFSDRSQWRRSLLAFVAGGVFVGTLAVMAGVVNLSRTDEAALGRAFLRALPTLDPGVKAKLLDHMKKSLP